MTSKQSVERALEQLSALVVGRQLAISSNGMEPIEKLDFLTLEVAGSLAEAAKAGDTVAMRSAQRKLDSLSSLTILARATLLETEWED